MSTYDTKDPRRAVLREILHGWDPLEPPPRRDETNEGIAARIAALDDADPLRAMLRESMEELEDAVHHIGKRVLCGGCESYSNECGCRPNVAQRMSGPLRELLARIRTLIPTEGDET